MNEIQKVHQKNKDLLVKQGFSIKTFINTPYKQVIYAYHKDGRKVEIHV